MTPTERLALIRARDKRRKDPHVFIKGEAPRMRAWKIAQLKREKSRALPEWRDAR